MLKMRAATALGTRARAAIRRSAGDYSAVAGDLAVPEGLRPTADEAAQGRVTLASGDALDLSAAPPGVRSGVWGVVVAAAMRMDPQRSDKARRPKKSSLHWVLQHAASGGEVEAAAALTREWRARMQPITHATTQLWAAACVRAGRPDVFVRLLMDRWAFRQLPVAHGMARVMRALGASGQLDDAFRLFALHPYYGLAQDATAYGALVEACCLDTSDADAAWRRALVVAEEALARDPPLITVAALRALEAKADDAEMARRYGALADQMAEKDGGPQAAEKDTKKPGWFF
ncbi:hypothetical protein GGI04_003796 [Coemansia thaxteri]|uniref:Uncharacterized protein n=1 Tax=Coemansia thaxteri TaxID=2663907 RepID=A0A9W8EG28_9FUNG|nr:hypothetical protein GGI04_003796 [Coemansia thaxteri]KAJ2005354.1 hypothetical protein H4R26_001989 [Coemansia thaxteri]KAJ2466407.1 hypothetical protein GGI02_004382 [Coemansia sp. RSA 2322]KAJ2485296.1 hypothetical protein EV174_001816 [Coemansia sp. RSA 2320]